MPKKIKYESFKYRLLAEANLYELDDESNLGFDWENFLEHLTFRYKKNLIVIGSTLKKFEELEFSLSEPLFYKKTNELETDNSKKNFSNSEDIVKNFNQEYFKLALEKLATEAGIFKYLKIKKIQDSRSIKEKQFHDAWAHKEDVKKIDVIQRNEALTAPEMRYITKQLGSLKGKKFLDLGCGLGEASIYFALKGAEVTACDLSEGMLNAVSELAKLNGVKIKTHLSSSEGINLDDVQFDIIYAGNLFHHVNIKETLKELKKYLKDNGTLVSWDPIHYNPIINLYRRIAHEVRTSDEHPLKFSDIRLFRKSFREVKTRYFWLSTLIIFIFMALGQHRNPNKERFWKVVIDESEKWSQIYRPLERLDDLLLKFIPPLRLMCWNVVIFSKK